MLPLAVAPECHLFFFQKRISKKDRLEKKVFLDSPMINVI